MISLRALLGSLAFAALSDDFLRDSDYIIGAPRPPPRGLKLRHWPRQTQVRQPDAVTENISHSLGFLHRWRSRRRNATAQARHQGRLHILYGIMSVSMHGRDSRFPFAGDDQVLSPLGRQ